MSTSVFASESKIDLLSADKTLAKSERKVILGMSQLGLETTHYTFPVYYTPAGKKVKTRRIGKWKVTLTPDFANKVLEDNYAFLIPNRYDKMIFNANEAKIITATKDIKVDISNIPSFNPGTSSYSKFKSDTLKYLNTNIAKKISKVLSAAKDVRYSEMNEKEAQTFITTKAKEIGMPASIVEKLVKSAYTFSVYMPKFEGSIFISQNIYKDIKGRTIVTYSTSLSAPITLKLAIDKLENDKFITSSEINSEAKNEKSNFLSNMFNSYVKGLSGSSSITTAYMPSSRNAQEIFNEAFKSSFKDNTLSLMTRLKEDRNYAVVVPLKSVDGGDVTLAIGNQEDVRIDHPFKVYRTEDGVETEIGLMKVRKTGDDCLLLPFASRTLTSASMIYGSSAEEADLAVEYPWTGVYGSLYFEQSMGTFTVNDKQTDTGSTSMVFGALNGDLGYILNSSMLSEIWLNFSIGIGMASYDILPTYNGFTPSGDDGSAYKISLGIEKRFYLFSGFYTSGVFDVDYEFQSYSYDGSTYDDGSLSLNTFSITPEIKLGYMLSPNVDFYSAVGYNIPISTDTSFKYNSGDSELDLSSTKYEKEANINIKLGVNIHLSFAGPFSRMFSKPSSRCDALKTKK
jgi:hypothetical protein